MQRGQHPPSCRVCLDDHAPEQMIAPCKCAGSIKWVHRYCLDEWYVSSKKRTQRIGQKHRNMPFSRCFSLLFRRTTGLSFSNVTKCPVCKFDYVMENAGPKCAKSAVQFFLTHHSQLSFLPSSTVFSPVVTRVTWILLMYLLKGVVGIAICGYLSKICAFSTGKLRSRDIGGFQNTLKQCKSRFNILSLWFRDVLCRRFPGSNVLVAQVASLRTFDSQPYLGH